MGFITRCPACATAFKVVPDQLKISEGWVRCGHCQEIFDATMDLHPWWDGAVPEAAAPEPEPPTAVPSEEPQSHSVADPQPTALASSPSADLVESVPAPVDINPADLPVVVTESGVDNAWPVFSADPDEVYPSEPQEMRRGFDDDAATAAPLSFVQKAEREAFWRRASVRWTLGLLSLLASAVLVFQWAWLWRDTLAANVPTARPALESMCALAGCRIEPPRSLTAVQLDSAALWRMSRTDFVFDVVLKNQAGHAVVTPALELTLTDATEQVLVRRVVLPQDWPQSTLSLGALQEWPVRFELELQPDEARGMTGYRALLFYP
jgi:predicted Zn finger-like uncharacterized protein